MNFNCIANVGPGFAVEKQHFWQTHVCDLTRPHAHSPTCVIVKAGRVEFAHVELQANDGEHEDGEEQKQANLQQRDHGLHDGFEHHL